MRSLNKKNVTRRGMTLTEVSIVAMIIGAVLAAIWGAVEAIYRNARISDTTKNLGLIAGKARSVYGISPLVQVDPALAGVIGAQTFAQSGIIPDDMLDRTVIPPGVSHAWHAGVTIDTTPARDGYTIGLIDVPQSSCTPLLMRLTGAARDPMMPSAGTATTLYAEASFPLTLTLASAACSLPLNTIQLTYLIKR